MFPGGLHFLLAKGMWIHLLLIVRYTLWPLYGQHFQSLHYSPQCYAGWYTSAHRLQPRNGGKVSTWSLKNFNVEKLHIILLFEADFNSNNKWLGHAIMLNVEQFNLLAPKQYGSWKQKSAIAQCLNKLLFYDIICFCQQPAALCSNDVKSCYDCIVLLVAALCFCRLGASQPSIFSLILTLHQMEHSIRTTFGSSKRLDPAKTGGNR